VRRAGFGSVAFGVLACGVIQLTPPALAPVNACTDNATCVSEFGDASVDGGSAVCIGGACSGAGFVPILVVTVPLETPIIGGNTFAIPTSRLQEIDPTQTRPGGACQTAGANCVFLPPLTTSPSDGFYQVTHGLAVSLWPPAGLRPNEGDLGVTTLPVGIPPTARGVTFHPMWLDPASGTPRSAAKLGLPLPDVTGSGTLNFAAGYGPTSADAGGTSGFLFEAFVPQPYAPTDYLTATIPDPAQFYTFDIVPDDPFSVFPPLLGPPATCGACNSACQFCSKATCSLSVAALQYTLSSNASLDLHDQNCLLVPLLDQPIVSPVVQQHAWIVTDTGTPSLAGWHAYVVRALDPGISPSSPVLNADVRRVSGTVTLPGGPNQPLLIDEATGTLDQTGETLFIDPPPGVDLPRYFQKAIGNIIQGPSFDYPALPSAVAITGFVQRPDGTPTTGQIMFTADGVNGVLVGTDGTTPETALLYSKTIPTTAMGEYEAQNMPPGSFRAYVMPDASDLALTIIDSVQVLTTPSLQPGKGLSVNLRTHVKGQVTLPNGMPVYAADVVIDSSADAPLSPSVDLLALPREVRGTTDVDGTFDVLSDPGAVDISIRPHDGTNYPWVVLTNFTVPPSGANDAGVSSASTVTLPTVMIPLPSLYQQGAPSQVLTDSFGNALPLAVVSAYAFPALVSQADGGAPLSRAARLLGVTTTDANGAFQLFVAPPQ
jgi:hypothetical protein